MFQTVCYYFLLIINKIFTYIHFFKTKLFGKIITKRIDNIYRWNKYIHCYITNTKIEPPDKYWISTWYIMKNDYDSPVFLTKETYCYPITNNLNSDIIDDIMNTYFKNTYFNCLYQLYNSPNIHEFLIIIKTNNVKRVVVCNIQNKNNLLLEARNNISDVRFLTVQYTHPKMKYTINIKLPDDFFICNNELLSKTFVKMWLEHQSEKYHYDMDYLIKIIDYNINQFDIKSNQSIVIYKNKYVIIENNEYTKLQT